MLRGGGQSTSGKGSHVVQSDHERAARDAETRAVVEAMLTFWAVQDVAQTVAVMADDIVSIVHLDEQARGMSGVRLGRDAVAEGLYGNLATWHYLSFLWQIVKVEAATATVQIAFEYEHQKTGLRHAGTMRKIIQVSNGEVCRVEVYHDTRSVEAYMDLVRAREAEIDAARDAGTV